MPAAATVFSWELYIDGVRMWNFGKISISQSISGYGMSGVATAIMTVTTYDDSRTAEGIPENAAVDLVCNGLYTVIPRFYVTSRRINGKITEWTCADAMSRAENLLTFDDTDFTDDKITVQSVLERVKTVCRASSIVPNVANDSILKTSVDRSFCEGRTGREVLEALSEALCGFWIAGKDTSCTEPDDYAIILSPFGDNYSGGGAAKYADIVPQGVKNIKSIILTDGEDIYTAGQGTAHETITIETQFASETVKELLTDRILADGCYTYEAWSCARGKTSGWMSVGSINFSGETSTKQCTNLTLYPSGAGLFFSASCNAVDEDEASYTSEVQRLLKRKLELNKINNNVAITGKGIYFFENGYKKMTAEEQKDAKYGFTVDKGVTEFDGAMVSKITPKTAYWNSDKTEAVVSYEGKKFKYNIKRDSEGNITDFSKEEVKEESE